MKLYEILEYLINIFPEICFCVQCTRGYVELHYIHRVVFVRETQLYISFFLPNHLASENLSLNMI